MEGPLDAEQFCTALVPLVQSPEEKRLKRCSCNIH